MSKADRDSSVMKNKRGDGKYVAFFSCEQEGNLALKLYDDLMAAAICSALALGK